MSQTSWDILQCPNTFRTTYSSISKTTLAVQNNASIRFVSIAFIPKSLTPAPSAPLDPSTTSSKMSSATAPRGAGWVQLAPRPPKPSTSLRTATSQSTYHNEDELHDLLLQEDIDTEPLTAPMPEPSVSLELFPGRDFGRYVNTSLDPLASRANSQPKRSEMDSNEASLQEEARRAKEALGMAPKKKKERKVLLPEIKAELLEALPDVEIDVAVYNPFGTFILPCYEIEIGNTTTLRELITAIQEIVDHIAETQKEKVHGPLLVSVIQVKIFNQEFFDGFPKIQGERKGGNTVRAESVTSPNSKGMNHTELQLAYEFGDLGDEDIPSADTVNWVVGPGSEEELYWEQLRTALQIAAAKAVQQESAMQAYKKPMLKVMTVKKVGLLSHFVGVHAFEYRQTPPERPPSPVMKKRAPVMESPIMENSTANKGKGKADHDGELVTSIHEHIRGNFPALRREVSLSEIEFAVQIAKSTYQQDDEQLSTAETAQQVLMDMKEAGRPPLRKLVPVEMNPNRKMKPLRKDLNWGTYQRMGGDPKMHKLFPLDDVPFKHVQYEFMPAGEDVEDVEVDESETSADSSQDIEPEDLEPYEALDPDLVEEFLDDKKVRKIVAYRERKEAAVGFDEGDDDKFLLGVLSPPKPKPATISPHAHPPPPTEPFPEFDEERKTQVSPLQQYGNTVQQQALNMLRQAGAMQQFENTLQQKGFTLRNPDSPPRQNINTVQQQQQALNMPRQENAPQQYGNTAQQQQALSMPSQKGGPQPYGNTVQQQALNMPRQDEPTGSLQQQANILQQQQAFAVPKQESPIRQPRPISLGLGAGFADILSQVNAIAPEPQPHEGPLYTAPSAPSAPYTTRPESTTQSQNPSAFANFAPFHPRPRPFNDIRTPSPATPLSLSQLNFRPPSAFKSFTSFNAAHAETRAQLAPASRGFYSTSPVRNQVHNPQFYNNNNHHMSPIKPQPQAQHLYNNNISPGKTQAQMSRAFNSPTMMSGYAVPAGVGGGYNYAAGPAVGGGGGGGAMYGGGGGGTQDPAAYSYGPFDQGGAGYYAGGGAGMAPPPGLINIGAGTSRGWNGSGGVLPMPRNVRPSTGGMMTRGVRADSVLRGESESFVAPVPGRERATSTYLRGVYAMGEGGLVQMGGAGDGRARAGSGALERAGEAGAGGDNGNGGYDCVHEQGLYGAD
ncbi:uncharacterized protein LY89DRAFT_765513 [Mollisia scopiformis]|uniref:Uncharacterized protein n=1 Tax=Mollisia scopiformis TaxID=149040 RepID=A0A132B732_MOLSC|nr:uncharacterized protein LY89DRAFT_765513 [Mollisia scopiformis]KUJ08053.1 hypothetical protein LY89DRAFT_765513 [Mollisia scopiformis]